MALESGTYISDFNTANPVDNTDHLSTLGSQDRWIKTAIKNTFPSVTGAVTVTHTQLNAVTSKAPQGLLTASGLTIGTGKIAGRTTASTGALEEIAIGSGLAMTAGVLSSTSALTLIATASASSSATIDFTSGIDSTYDEYELHIINAVPATDATNLWLRTSTDAGSSFAASASDYTYDTFGGATTTAAQIVPNETAMSNTTALGGASYVVKIFDPSGTAHNKRIAWFGGSPPQPGGIRADGGTAWRAATAAINGLRVMFSSGAVASGKFKLYGVKKS